MLKKDMIIGEIYYIENSQKYLVKCSNDSLNNTMYGNPYIALSNNGESGTYSNYSGAWYLTTSLNSQFKEVRLATPNERKWFEECTKVRTFIKLSNIKFDEVVNDYQIC